MHDSELITGLCSLNQKTFMEKNNFLVRATNCIINEITEKIPLNQQTSDLIINYSIAKLHPLITLDALPTIRMTISIINDHIEGLMNQLCQQDSHGHLTNTGMELAAKLVNTLIAPLTWILELAAANELKKTLAAYEHYLVQQIIQERKEVTPDLIAFVLLNQYSEKMAERYRLIKELNTALHDQEILTHTQNQQARECLKLCLQATPTWSEKPFLQKISDFFHTQVKGKGKTYLPSKEQEFFNEVNKKLP